MKEDLMELIINGETVSAKSRGMTARSFVTSLGVSFGLCFLYVAIFSALRKRLRVIYEPRAFALAKHLRIAPTTNGYLGWLIPTCTVSLKSIPPMVGLDAYFFLRYVILVMFLCGSMALLMVPILLPLHLTSHKDGVHGFDRLSISGISDEQASRHIAHLVLCTLSVVGSLYLFQREFAAYFRIRAEYIVSQDLPHSSSTLLIKGLYPEFMESETAFREFFAGLATESGGLCVKRIWFNRDYTKLQSLVAQQSRILNKIERQELWLLKLCLSDALKAMSASRGSNGGGSSRTTSRSDEEHSAGGERPCEGLKYENITGSLWRRYASDTTTALLDGSKGDTLISLKSELNAINATVTNMRANTDLFPKVSSCFIQFDSRLTCFVAARSIGAGARVSPGLHIYDRVYPTDIVWSSLSTAYWVERLWMWIATFLNYIFVFGWAIPIALVSIFTQVEVMARWVPEVQWLVRVPRIRNLMTSVVSPFLMSSLTARVPMIFRGLARLKGYPTKSLIEMDVQKYLFLFMFFQLFLVVTLATGLPSLIVKIMLNTSEGAITLASSLPKASTFFMSYLLASSLSTAGNTLLQLQQLMLRAWDRCFSCTPRQNLHSVCRYSVLHWGSTFPLITNIGAIAIAYSLINPIILISAVLGCAALFVAFKYRILYGYVPQCIADGDYYPRAIFQLFSGLYCQEISLLGTLLVSQQIFLALMTSCLLILTIAFHHKLSQDYTDMSSRIPLRGTSTAQVSADDLEAQRRSRYQKSGARASAATKAPGSSTPKSHSSAPGIVPGGDSSEPVATPASPGGDSIRTLVSAAESVRSDANRSQESVDAGPTAEQAAGQRPTSHSFWMEDIEALTVDFNSLDEIQQEHLANEMFQHPDCQGHRPCVWIPKDELGIALDQVMHMRECLSDMNASCSGATIDMEGHVIVTLAPPDYDPRELMRF